MKRIWGLPAVKVKVHEVHGALTSGRGHKERKEASQAKLSAKNRTEIASGRLNLYMPKVA
jgi:hypothetical protein